MKHRIANKTYNGHGLYRDVNVVLPDNTIRLLYKDNVTPTFTKGTATQIVRRGGSDEMAGEYLGHTPRTVTSRHYTSKGSEHIEEIFNRYVRQ